MRTDGALAFVESCTRETDIGEIIRRFRESIQLFGFSYSACGCWYGVGPRRLARFFFVDWPEHVGEVYASQNIFSKDPLVFAARRRMTPFTWEDVFENEPLLPEMREVYRTANGLGLLDGFAIPIHGPANYQGLVSLLATQKLSLSPADRGLLEMMSRIVHDRCRIITGFGALGDVPPKLSTRELECMKWVAAGKSNWEIGQLLGISASTVHFHVERVKKKLNKTKRTEAVATLIMHGFI